MATDHAGGTPERRTMKNDEELDARTQTGASVDSLTAPTSELTCPRCGVENAHDIIEGRCWDCRIAEEEADWMDEDEDEGGAPWGR